MLPADPRDWIFSQSEPAAHWLILAGLDRGANDRLPVGGARAACLDDPGFRSLTGRLGDWEKEIPCSGHHSPSFTPNILELLADLGAGPGDVPRIERILDQMLAHQDDEGRFQSFGRARERMQPAWGALLCDAHIILDILVRFGRGEDPRVVVGLKRMALDVSQTAQGLGWLCRPHPASGFRGPGRKDEFCPMVTLEALRCFSRLPESGRPSWVLDAARTCLRAWRERGTEKPYMFGHGRQFKMIKWPSFWYGAYAVLETLSRYPALWRGRKARAEDRRALAEMAACLIAYNFNPDGRVVPRSCRQGFESFSFGQKKAPSPTATALAFLPLARLSDLGSEIAAVDVRELKSSKGGTGKAVPPTASSK